MSYRMSRGKPKVCPESTNATLMWFPFLYWCPTVCLSLTEACIMAKHLVYLWCLSVNDTNLCVQVIPIVVHYKHLAVSVIGKLGATRSMIMHDLWSKDARSPDQTWTKFGLSADVWATVHFACLLATDLALSVKRLWGFSAWMLCLAFPLQKPSTCEK